MVTSSPPVPAPDPSVRRILFVGWTRVGDAVISTSLIAHLLDRFPAAVLTIVCGPLAAEVLKTVPRTQRLVVLAKKPWNRHWIELIAGLIGTRWDLVVDLRDSAVSYLVFSRRTLRFRKAAVPRRRVEELADLAGLGSPPWPRLWLTSEHRAAAARIVDGYGPWMALCPGAGRPEKLWPADRFAALARTLAADGPLAGARVLLVGAPGEEHLGERLRTALGADRVVDVIGRESLLVQAACVARSGLFVGNDSGFTHAAAALGVPTLGIFGPTDPRQYAPFGPRAAHVGGSTDGPQRAIEDVTVDEVAAAARRLLADGGPAPQPSSSA